MVLSRDVVFDERTVFQDIQKGDSNDTTVRIRKKVTFSENLEEILGSTANRNGSAKQSLNETRADKVQSGASTDNGYRSDQDESDKIGTGTENVQLSSDTESDSNTSDEESPETESGASSEGGYLLARDRQRRVVKPPSRFEDADYTAYALSSSEAINLEEPKSFLEAQRSKDRKQWNKGMTEEMDSLKKNYTWKLKDRPSDQKVIGCKWIYKLKQGIPGVEKPRFKARLVAKGYSQTEGIDYNEVFAPVVKHTSIRILLSAVANFNLELEQMDVKTAFLHGVLRETIYMEQPEGFVEKGKENKVCLLKKSLYGLKQSPREWNARFDSFIQKKGFKRSDYDPCVYLKGNQVEDSIYLLLYVDDMLIASKSKLEIEVLKTELSTEFEMKDLGEAKKILGMEISRNRKEGVLIVSQKDYISKVLKSFNMEDCRSVQSPIGSHFKVSKCKIENEEQEARDMENIPYASAVGSLMYAMISTRPDIAYGVGLVSRYMSKPTTQHWLVIKWLMKYMKGTEKLSIAFTKGTDFKLRGFCDSDYASDLDRRRSTSGFLFTLGGNVICWRSRLQKVVALSTTEAEYISLSDAGKEAIWLRGLCKEMGFKQSVVSIFCDSQSAIHLAKNRICSERTKHVQIKFNFIRDIIEEEYIEVVKIHTSTNPADMLTKPLSGEKFRECLKSLNMVDT